MPEELVLLPGMLFTGRELLDKQFCPAGYNIVINSGAVADQRVMHCHVHLIPRYRDERENPPGGIQGFLQRPGHVL